MKSPFFVEILSRSKEVRHRLRVDSLPIRIGRAYDNDIILDDPHIAAHHVVVTQDDMGCLKAIDQGSRNGIYFSGLRRAEMPVDADKVFQLGCTYLRIRPVDVHVEDEIYVPRFHRWEGWLPALVGLIMIASLSCFFTWIDDGEKFEVTTYFFMMIMSIFCGLVWAGIWSIVSRAFGEYARLGRHLFILGSGLVGIFVFTSLIDIAAYAFSLEVLTRYSSHVFVALFLLMVFSHLQQIKPNRTRLFAKACVTLFTVCSGIILVANYQRDKMLADELFMDKRFPPSIRIATDKPVEELIDDAKSLRIKADKDRAKAVTEEVNSSEEE